MGLMKKLTSAVVTSSLVLGLVGSAFAAPSTEQLNDAYARMSTYGIVQGMAMPDGTVDPALGETLTRAQLVTILSRAFGEESTAQLLKGAKSFDDVAANEWYSGYVALIKNMAEAKGIAVGYEDGSFRPAQNVKAIEALAFVMKLLGVAPGTGANWVADTIMAAKDAGVITSADAEAYLADPNADATRGLAFGLADAIFGTYEVAEGKTVYTTYVDDNAPVLTINKPAEPTTTKTTYTVNGKAEDAVAVYYGSEKLTANADGSFTVEISLEVGENAVTFSAVDLAGNVTTESFKLTRNVDAPAKVAAELSATSVKAGAEAELTYSVTDANGVALEVAAEDVDVVVGGEIGSFDKATGKFTAATKTGTGTITVTYGNLTPATVNVTVVAGDLTSISAESTSVAPGSAIKLVAKDAYGNVIEGATFSEDSADAFIEGSNFIASKAGQYTVTATVDGASVTGVVGVFGSVAKTVIEAPAVMVANGESEYTIKVKAVDAEGNHVTSANYSYLLTTPAGFNLVKTEAVKDGTATYVFTIDPGLAEADLTLTGDYDHDNDGFGDAGTKSGETVVTPAAQVATKITLTPGNEYLATDLVTNTDTITVKVLDQADVEMLFGTWEMDITVTGSALLDNGEKTDSISLGSGSTFTISPEDAGAAGSISLSASFAGLTTGTATVKAAMPGIATGLKLTANKSEVKADSLADAVTNGNVVTYTVTAVDRNGVPTTTQAPAVVTLTLDSDLANDYSFYEGAAITNVLGSTTDTLDLSAGPVTFTLSGSIAGSYDVSVQSEYFAKVSSSYSVKANSPAVVALTKGEIDVLRGTEATAVATAQLYDAFGNKAAVSGVPVTFGHADYDGVKLNGKGEAAKVTTDETGKGTVNVTMSTYVDLATITVVDGDDTDIYALTDYDTAKNVDLTWVTSAAPSDALAITVVNAIAETITGSVVSEVYLDRVVRSISADGVDDNGTPSYVSLKFTVTDNFGRVVTGLAADQARNFKLSSSVSDLDLSSHVIYEVVDASFNPTGTYVTDAIVWTKAGSVDVNVEVVSVAKELKLTRSFTVVPGAATNVALAEGADFAAIDVDTATSEVALEANKVTKLTAQVTDQFGNVVSATNNTETVRVYLSAPSAAGYVSFRNADGAEISYVDVKAGRNSATFYVVTDRVGVTETFALDAYTLEGDAWDGPNAAVGLDIEDTAYGTNTVTIK